MATVSSNQSFPSPPPTQTFTQIKLKKPQTIKNTVRYKALSIKVKEALLGTHKNLNFYRHYHRHHHNKEKNIICTSNNSLPSSNQHISLHVSTIITTNAIKETKQTVIFCIFLKLPYKNIFFSEESSGNKFIRVFALPFRQWIKPFACWRKQSSSSTLFVMMMCVLLFLFVCLIFKSSSFACRSLLTPVHYEQSTDKYVCI